MSINKSKAQLCYELKIAGRSNSQIAAEVGVNSSSVPTRAKNYMLAHSLPHWSEDSVMESTQAYSPIERTVNEDTPAQTRLSLNFLDALSSDDLIRVINRAGTLLSRK